MSAGSLRFLIVLLFGAALLRSSPARAGDPALAQDLFEQGRQAMASEDYRVARARFESSYQADPAPGTLLNLAVCEERLRLWNAALEHLRVALEQIGAQDRRRSSVSARLEELRARIPHLTLVAEAPLASSLIVSLDATALDPTSLGAPVPIDPGPHTIRWQGQRGVVCSHDFEAHEGESIEWRIPVDSTWIAPAQAPPPPAPASHAAIAWAPRRERSTLALWTGAVGLASLAAGLAAGVEVLESKSTVSSHCDSTGCDRAGIAAAASGRTWSWVSTIATGVGAAGLGTSIVFALTTRPSQPPAGEVALYGHF